MADVKIDGQLNAAWNTLFSNPDANAGKYNSLEHDAIIAALWGVTGGSVTIEQVRSWYYVSVVTLTKAQLQKAIDSGKMPVFNGNAGFLLSL